MNLSRYKILLSKIRIYGWQKITAWFDAGLFKLGINSSVKWADTMADHKYVVYLGENLPPRIARLVKWLKRTDLVTAILICQQDGYNTKFSNSSFDQVILFRNRFHLYRILSKLKNPGALIHSFGPKSFFPDCARTFLPRHKFIYDMQDVLAIYYGLQAPIPWYQNEFPHEKNCLSLSHGLVSHGLEPIPASRIYHIAKRPPVLYFPLGADSDIFVKPSHVFNPDDIHLVYAGEIHSSFRNAGVFGNVQFVDLIQSLSDQQLHFHVYPSPSTLPVYFEEYKTIAARNKYFHLHQAVPQSGLSSELAKYDFGIIPFFKSRSAQSHDKYFYSTSLKLFNFIEAGLPILLPDDITFQHWLANRYGAAITLKHDKLHQLGEQIRKCNYHQLQNLVLRNRQNISLQHCIPRLSRFYEQIIKA